MKIKMLTSKDMMEKFGKTYMQVYRAATGAGCCVRANGKPGHQYNHWTHRFEFYPDAVIVKSPYLGGRRDGAGRPKNKPIRK